MASAHAKRWVTALIALPVLLLLIGMGGRIAFALLVASAVTVSLLEYYRLALPCGPAALRVVGVITGWTVTAFFYVDGLRAIPVLLAAAFLGSAAICVADFDPKAPVAEALHGQISGLLYIPFMLGHLILIRHWPSGVTWTFLLVAVVFAGDTGAFYVGRAAGRRKLAPRLSPGKTVEGAFGGLAAGLVVGILFKCFFFNHIGWLLWITLILLLGVAAQTGDLFESMLKRSVHIKDSGNIMPGHGGLLDRIDGLIFATPCLYYFRTYFF